MKNMMKNIMKKFFVLTLLFLNIGAFGLTLDEMVEPKGFLGRLGTGDKVEAENAPNIVLPSQKAQYQKKENENQVKLSKSSSEQSEVNANYADLSLKKLALDVSYELDLDATKTNADLNVLWQATTARSETMKYTIYKLSNPDEDKPNDSVIKKIIKPIANFSSLAGASVAGDPFMATGALIGGGLVNAFMKDDKEVNYKFSKVSDADMVLLVRKIDDLQKKLLDLYVDYKTKEQLAKMTEDNYKRREEVYLRSQNKSREELVIADVYYRNAKIDAQRAKDDFMTSRAILENLVGLDALKKIEE